MEIFIDDICSVIFKTISDAVLVLDKEGKFLFFNDAFIEFYGFKDRSACPRTLQDMGKIIEQYKLDGTKIAPDNWCVKKAFLGEPCVNCEFMLTKKSTSSKWYGSYSCSPITENGKIIGVVMIARNITKQKEAEKRVSSIARFPEENPDPILRISRGLKITYANSAAKKLLDRLGIKEDLAIPKKLLDHILPLIRKNGTRRLFELGIGKSTYEFTLVEIKEENYFNLYGKDIADRKRVEMAKIKTMENKILGMERKKIARELHDSVTQALFSSTILSETILESFEKNPKNAYENIKTINELSKSALSEIRTLLYGLVSENTAKEELVPLFRHFVESLNNKGRINFQFISNGKFDPPKKVKHEFYRIAQEAINNIIKHSSATNAKIALTSEPDKQELIITDDGSGFNIKDKSSKRKFGLGTMRERANLVGASLKIKSTPGEGTTIALRRKKKK